MTDGDPTKNGCLLNARQDRTQIDDSKKYHRFEAIHQQNVQMNARVNTDDTNPAQRSFSKGYADGFDTARKFATVNKSKLGFTGQFIQDVFGSAEPSVVAEENYGQGFRKGLSEGEARFL